MKSNYNHYNDQQSNLINFSRFLKKILNNVLVQTWRRLKVA